MGRKEDLIKSIKRKRAKLKTIQDKDIRFLKNAIKYKGKRTRVRYSKGNYTPKSGLSEDVITIIAKDYGDQIPAKLNPKSETDLQTDYFATERARIKPDNKYYKRVLAQLKKDSKF